MLRRRLVLILFLGAVVPSTQRVAQIGHQASQPAAQEGLRIWDSFSMVVVVVLRHNSALHSNLGATAPGRATMATAGPGTATLGP